MPTLANAFQPSAMTSLVGATTAVGKVANPAPTAFGQQIKVNLDSAPTTPIGPMDFGASQGATLPQVGARAVVIYDGNGTPYCIWFDGPYNVGPDSGVTSFDGRTGTVVPTSGDYTVSEVTGAAPLASPALTGSPTAPTQTTGDNSTKLATTAFVTTALASVVITNAPSVDSITSSATPSVSCATFSELHITALAVPITSVTITGSPGDSQPFIFEIADNGTARAITWGTGFGSMDGITLPTTTTTSKTLVCSFKYSLSETKWILWATGTYS